MDGTFLLDEDSVEVEGLPGDKVNAASMERGSFGLLCALNRARGFAPPVVKRQRAVFAEPKVRRLWPSWYRPPRRIKRGTDLVRSIAEDFGLSFAELRAKGQGPYLVDARAVVARVLHDRGVSYPQIARIIGRKDHSTVMNLVERFPTYCERNPFVLESYERHTGDGI